MHDYGMGLTAAGREDTILSMDNIQRLIDIVARLRGPDGCPWDKAQNHRSLKPYLLEEAYETLEAIDDDDPEKLEEELGDLLLHIIFHAQIAAESGKFDIDEVGRKICDKLIMRHPHVFAEKTEMTTEKVLDQWEAIKKINRTGHSALDGLPRELPALLKAFRIQEKVGRLGFDWQMPKDVLAKIKEEIAEFEAALNSDDKDALEDELGDLLFSLVNLSRHLKLNAESALQKTNDKFIRRFRHIEKRIDSSGRKIEEVTLEEMDRLWEEGKDLENSR